MNNDNYNCDREIAKQLVRLYENIRKLRNSDFTPDFSGNYDKNRKEINNDLVIEEQELATNLLAEVGEKNI